MVCKDQLQYKFTGGFHLLGIGMDHHSILNLGVAGGVQMFMTLDFNHTHAAGADFVDILEIAECRYADFRSAGNLQNCLVR